jgi:hypothetical protein
MTAIKQFQEAFAATDRRNIMIETKTHKQYYLHRDQLSAIMDGGLFYGVPLNPHPRRRNRVYWIGPENVKIIAPAPTSE